MLAKKQFNISPQSVYTFIDANKIYSLCNPTNSTMFIDKGDNIDPLITKIEILSPNGNVVEIS